MAHFEERKHPRHKENGRFREKHGSDATAYAKRISAKIAASRGHKDSNDDEPTAAEKRAMENLRTGHRPSHGEGSSDAPTAAEKRAMENLRTGHRPEHGEGSRGPAKKAAPKKAAPKKAATTTSATRQRAAKTAGVKADGAGSAASQSKIDQALEHASAARHSGASTKAEIDAELHPKYKNHSREELRAVIRGLLKSKALHAPATADSLARLVNKMDRAS